MWNNSDDQNMDQQNIIDQFNDDLISYDEAREVAIQMKQKYKYLADEEHMEIQRETEEEKQKKGKMQNMNHKGTQNWKRDTKNE